MKISKTRLWGMRFAIVLSVLICFFGGNTDFVAAQQLSPKQKQWYRYGIDYADSEASQCSTDSKTGTKSTLDESQFAQHLFVGVSSSDVANQILAKYNIGGIFLMSSGSPGRVSEELKAGIPGMQSAAKTPLLIATDQEYTYTVNSFGLADDKKATDLAGMSYDAVKAEGARFGTALSAAGVNMDFAPDTDLLSDGNDVIANNYRAISSSPDVVTQKAKAFSEGLAGTKVTPVIKHFPGHGHSSGDSHQTLPSTPPLAQLEQSDILPFKNLASQENMAIMIGHLNVPDLTNGKPASMSSEAYKYLRDKLNYKGLVITDELAGMVGAGSGSLGSKIADSLNAGADMALFNVSDMADFESAYKDALGSVKNADDSIIIARKRFYGLNVPDTSATTSNSGSSSGSTDNSACCDTGGGSVNGVQLTGTNNTEKIMSYFMSKGASLAGAAGIVGNFTDESAPGQTIDPTGPDPKAVSGAGYYGIEQWGGDRLDGPNGLRAFAAAHNAPWDDLAIQLQFAGFELGIETWDGHKGGSHASAWDAVKNAPNTEAGALQAEVDFERIAEGCAANVADPEASCGVSIRAREAKKAFNKYSDAPPLTGSSTASQASTGSSGATTCKLGNAPITGDFVFYTQWDPKSAWHNIPFASGTIGSDGCGPSSAAEVIATWKDKSVTPKETAEYILSIGAQYQGSRLPEVFEHFGMKSEYIGSGDLLDKAIAALNEGKMVIASASGSNPYTPGGHFVVFRGITPDGQILLGDPNAGAPGSGLNREQNNVRPWSPDEIRAATGGSFNSMNIITNPGKPV